MDKNSNIDQNQDANIIFKEAKVNLDMVTEGKATVFLKSDENNFAAFYNPAQVKLLFTQEFNRDLSITSINTYMKFKKHQSKKFNVDTHKFKICEPLSATGLRSIRYSLELNPNKLEEIVAGDMDKNAIKVIEKNLVHNKIKFGENTSFKINCSEASQFLYSKMKYFDIIDLDPYGTAVPLVDSAIQSLRNGGLLCVTFTDMAVLCGNYQETCYYKYGCIPYKSSFCHEVIDN
jgi:tRNA (guanine26-N2/guanine27-N2)-dimethyltransferase